MSQNQPIAFEIEIKKFNASPDQAVPAIKKKLEELSNQAPSPPQLEDIEKKIFEARNRRLDKRVRNSNTDERLKYANERRTNLVKEFTTKTQKVVETKLETAEQLRQKALNAVLEKAKKEYEKVLTAKGKLDEDAKKKGEKIQNIESKLESAHELRQKIMDAVLEKAKKESEKLNKAQESRQLVVKKKGEKIESKLVTADQLRSVMINQKVEQAKKFTSKIDKAKESRQRSLQQRETRLQDNIEKVSVGSQKGQAHKQKTAERAKSHVEKVQKVAAEQK